MSRGARPLVKPACAAHPLVRPSGCLRQGSLRGFASAVHVALRWRNVRISRIRLSIEYFICHLFCHPSCCGTRTNAPLFVKFEKQNASPDAEHPASMKNDSLDVSLQRGLYVAQDGLHCVRQAFEGGGGQNSAQTLYAPFWRGSTRFCREASERGGHGCYPNLKSE